MSSVFFPNTTAPYFPYNIPYNQTQECDIYGLACQTESITVGVNLTTTTTSTVLPCSLYLTAQSKYLASAVSGQNGDLDMTWGVYGLPDYVQTWTPNFWSKPRVELFCTGQ